MGIGTFKDPGSGCLPFWAGAALGTFAVILVIQNIMEEGVKGKIANPWKGAEWNRVLLVFIALLVYGILLARMGYLVMTFGLTAFLFGVIRRPNLWIQLVMGFCTASATYIIFYVWLKVQLPRGIFGF